MAANVAVTYTFTNGTAADAAQVNQDFTDLVSWINTNAVHLDGSKAFTGAPSYAADPVSANQLCRKSYTDGLVTAAVPQTVFKEVKLRRVAAQTLTTNAETSIEWDTEDADASGFFPGSGFTLTVPSGCDGLYAVSARVTFAASVISDRLNLAVNGSTVSINRPFAESNAQKIGSWVVDLRAGDTLIVSAAQDSGSSTTMTGSLTMLRLAD